MTDLTRKAFREELNRGGYQHRHGRYTNRTRPYGDYLYAQDREKFQVDYQDWLAQKQKARGMSEQTERRISDERLNWVADHPHALDVLPGEASDIARELIQARSDLADVEDLLPAPAGPYQTMGERTKLLKDQGEYAQEMCGRAVKLLEAARDKFTALRASHKRLVEALEGANRLFKEPSPFYIKKLGSPITNGDQAVIDKVFIDIEAALAEARKLEGK